MPESGEAALRQSQLVAADLSALGTLSEAAEGDRRGQPPPTFDVRTWLAEECFGEYYDRIVAWGYDKLVFLQRATPDDIDEMVAHSDVNMLRVHRKEFVAAWERLKQRYSRSTAEATEERQASGVVELDTAGRPAAPMAGQELLGALHRSPTVDKVAPVDAGQAAAATATGDEVVPMDAAGYLVSGEPSADRPPPASVAASAAMSSPPTAPGEVGELVHDVAIAPLATLVTATTGTLMMVEVTAVAAVAPGSAPAQAPRGPVDAARDSYA